MSSAASIRRARVRYWSDPLHVWTVRGYAFRWFCPHCGEYGNERTKPRAYAALQDHTLERHGETD